MGYYKLQADQITFTPDQVPLGQKTTVTAVPDHGYIIKTLDVEYMDYMGNTTYYSTYNNGQLTIDFTGVADDKANEATVYSVLADDPNVKTYYTLPTVSHVTFNPLKAQIGHITKIAVTPEQGYIINNLAFSATNPNTGEDIFDSSYSNGYIDLDLTSFRNKDAPTIGDKIQVTSDIKQITVTDWTIPKADGLSFTISDQPTAIIKLGTKTNINIVLDSHYRWTATNKGKGLVLDDGTVLGNFQGTGTSYLIDLTNYTDADKLTTAHWELNYEKYDFSDEHEKQIPIILALTNCSSDTQSVLENTTKTITLTADNGYYFDDDVTYSGAVAGVGYGDSVVKATKTSTITVPMTVGSYHDYETYLTNKATLPKITATAIKPTTVPTGTKSIHIYDMTDGEVTTFMDSLLSQFGDDEIENVDFTKYVQQIYRIPFNVPDTDTSQIKNIQVGKYNVSVITKEINQDKLIIDCGNIKVEPQYHNSNDYSPIECLLYLPFTKEISLNINDILNHTINVKYNIDLLNGETTVIVSNESNEIYTNQFNISTSLEYYGLYEDTLVGRLNSTYINDILQAYIKLVYNKPIANLVSYETNEHGTLKDYHGFVKTKNSAVSCGTQQEQQEIESLLDGGIIIKWPYKELIYQVITTF